jgi:Domain of unknown function (DUF397)
VEDKMITGWRKSSYSGNGGGNCVEAANAARTVAVRDSKDAEGPKLAVPTSAWASFTRRLKRD